MPNYDMKKTWVIVVGLCSFFACTTTVKKQEITNTPQAKDTLQTLAKKELIPLGTITEILPDKNEMAFVKDTGNIRIMEVGVFHGDEVDTTITTQWYGLYKNTIYNYIKKASPKFSIVKDEIVDSDDEKTGIEVSVANNDNCILLITGTDLPEGDITTAYFFNEEPMPKDTVYFKKLGSELPFDYKNTMLTATSYGDFTSDSVYTIIQNYKLIVTQNVNDTITKQELLYMPNGFDDTMITILWAGDIDGDGLLDLYIDATDHYNVSAPTLFLSSEAGEGELLKRVAWLRFVGC